MNSTTLHYLKFEELKRWLIVLDIEQSKGQVLKRTLLLHRDKRGDIMVSSKIYFLLIQVFTSAKQAFNFIIHFCDNILVFIEWLFINQFWRP